MKKIAPFLQQKPYIGYPLTALLITFVVECLCRHSVLGACSFFAANPLAFLFNALIIVTMLFLSLFFPKRLFAYLTVSIFWLVLGVVSFVMKFYRVTPLSASDVLIFKSITDIFSIYLSKKQGITILTCIGIGIVIIPIVWKKIPNWPYPWKKAASFSALSAVLLFACSGFAGAAFSNFTNLPNAYSNYGFTYCFSLSVVDSGVKKPTNYSLEMMNNIVNRLTKKGKVETSSAKTVTACAGSNVSSDKTTVKSPNIIFIQLESFFDVNDFKSIHFSHNPTPNFSALRESFPSSYVTVPVFGCGTVNTEFEILSGMNLNYFGPNEYPYSTILKTHTCESMCYDLKKENYATHAVHNNRATFYDRRHVYANLGFDTFTPMEYMQNITYNPLGWTNDSVLTGEILKAMKSTSQRDFVYAVTVQSHGKYPSNLQNPDNYPITVSGTSSDEQKSQLTYYASQMQQTDAFLGALLSSLSQYDEPTIVVAYGDHLPTITGLTAEDLTNGSLYQTPYIVWSNYGFKMSPHNVYAYQLGSDVMKALNIDDGYINQLHQGRANNANYQEDLHALQYDMLYGKQEVFNGVNPYPPTDLKLGIDEISVTSVTPGTNGFYVHGKNFTPFSQVMVGTHVLNDTQWMSATLLWVPDSSRVKEGDSICVAQVTSKGTSLSTSNAVPYPS